MPPWNSPPLAVPRDNAGGAIPLGRTADCRRLLVKLQPTATFTSDGTAIILATVALIGGAVTGLSGADRQLARLAATRRGGGAPRCPGGAGPQVGDAVSGRIGPLARGGCR